MTTTDAQLAEFLAAAADKLGVPGTAVGVWVDGREVFACYGVTNIENPLPVTEDTLFKLGSVSKSFTATALMRLVEAGKIDLDAPVRRYVAEAPAEMTVLNLMNHTAGLDTRMVNNTGDGDDALARYVDLIADVPTIGPVNGRASYSQIGFNLAGRVIEMVTGSTFEQAVEDLVLAPLQMAHSTYRPDQAMLRRFSVGHNNDEHGQLAVARQWNDTRANNPGGGLASTVADQLRFARFHLGDGTTETGQRLLSADTLTAMRRRTVELAGSSLGDGFGICWFLRPVGDERAFGHTGSSNGQFADLQMIAERGFAVTVMSNAGPDSGLQLNEAVARWAMEHYLGVVERDPEPLPYDAEQARRVAGHYENEFMTITVDNTGTGLTMACAIKPEVRAAMENEIPADLPAATMGLLPGGQYIVTEGGLRGQRGIFTLADDGTITGLDAAGRLYRRR